MQQSSKDTCYICHGSEPPLKHPPCGRCKGSLKVHPACMALLLQHSSKKARFHSNGDEQTIVDGCLTCGTLFQVRALVDAPPWRLFNRVKAAVRAHVGTLLSWARLHLMLCLPALLFMLPRVTFSCIDWLIDSLILHGCLAYWFAHGLLDGMDLERRGLQIPGFIAIWIRHVPVAVLRSHWTRLQHALWQMTMLALYVHLSPRGPPGLVLLNLWSALSLIVFYWLSCFLWTCLFLVRWLAPIVAPLLFVPPQEVISQLDKDDATIIRHVEW